ncbi:uncharacterized protein L199_000484 [Kwoniella botswanensis]|uniref:uncharacterized protein n=1 Tax=Kwoniella botswanensis TaxID=1268659 RepID=UPI00315D2261
MPFRARKSSRTANSASRPPPRSLSPDQDDDEEEEEQARLDDLFSPDSPTLTPTDSGILLTKNEKDTLIVLHQLCAFEHVLMEFFAGLDGLKIAPVRGSKIFKFDRPEMFDNSDTGRQARRNDEIGGLEGIIERITHSQKVAKDNIIPEDYLDRIRDNFIAALRNPFLHLRESKEVPGQVGLFVKPAEPPSRIDVLTRKGKTPNMDGIRFELFAFPRKIKKPEEHGFLDDLTFDYKHKKPGEKEGKNYVLMGLGMARVINHHCQNKSIEWLFGANALKFESDYKIGRMSSKLVEIPRRTLKPGMEIFGYYGDEFARLDCICSCTWLHTSTEANHAAFPGPSTHQYRADTPIEYPASRADSMDLNNIHFEGSSRLSPARHCRTPSYSDWDRDHALSENGKDSLKRQKKKRKKGTTQEEEDDDEVEYVTTMTPRESSSARQTRSSTQKKKKKPLQRVDSDTEEDDIPGTWGRTSAQRQEEADVFAIDDGETIEILGDNVTTNPTKMEIYDQLTRLDTRLDKHMHLPETHEDRLITIVSELMDSREKISEDRKEIERCRVKQRILIDRLRRKDKGKGKHCARDRDASGISVVDLEDIIIDEEGVGSGNKASSSMCSSQ